SMQAFLQASRSSAHCLRHSSGTSAWTRGNPPNTARRVRAATIIVSFIAVPPARRRAAAGVPADPAGGRRRQDRPSPSVKRGVEAALPAPMRNGGRHIGTVRRHVGTWDTLLDAGLAHARLPGRNKANDWPLVARTLYGTSGHGH